MAGTSMHDREAEPRASERPSVAIVGGGIAGLTAALGLQGACRTVVFEAHERVGGHILPYPVTDPRGRPHAVDTAFVVFVPETYPRLTALLGHLGVAHAPAPTTFRITDELRGLSFSAGELVQLCGTALPAACRRELLALFGVLVKVRREGPEAIDDVALSQWLQHQGWRSETIELGVLPWVASFWGLQPETVLTVSARVALRELARNAGPLQMHRVVPSTQGYLDALVAALHDTELRPERALAVRLHDGPRVETAGGSEAFDRVVVATDAIEARVLLAEAGSRLHEVLGRFEYEPTVAVLHRDTRDLPEDRTQWCTFHHRRRRDADRVRSVTTWVLDLLHEWHDDPARIEQPTLLSTGDPGLVDEARIDPARVLATFRHRHLVSTPQVVASLPELPALDEGQPFTLAGSYLGLGALHEDALASGVRAANKLRRELGLPPAAWPWPSRGLHP
jgi:predicted NAD/FAD-binding protein